MDESFMMARGLKVAGFPEPMHGSFKTRLRRFKAEYGCKPIVCVKVWNDLMAMQAVEYRSQSKVDHLFWCLFFLKKYPNEDEMVAKFNKDEKTVRKWVWFYIHRIQELKEMKVSMHDLDEACFSLDDKRNSGADVSPVIYFTAAPSFTDRLSYEPSGRLLSFGGWNRLPHSRAYPLAQVLVLP